ncbi:hypothetical protein BFG60_1315 [Microcystis aeruginosa NIES-98]|nr:hypothetical protein BFG60_1315 [Microcystis aeruginosa NIES-98]
MSSRYFDQIEMHLLKIVSSPPYQGGIKGGSAPPLSRGD